MAIDWTGFRFGKGVTRMEKKAAVAKDARALEAACVATVDRRDRMRCRACGRKVLKTLALVPNRAERHHLTARSDAAVRYDPRNRALLCHRCHEQVTTHRLVVDGTTRQLFRASNGKLYPDANKPLQWVTK